jgi:histidyl-tRNA synthetase
MPDSMRCRGMRDLMPDEMRRFRLVDETFRKVCEGWGYEEVRTPTVEHLHLFTSAGTLSPQMLGRVYSFLDWDGWSGERVVLRPDSTIPVARMYAERTEPGEVWKRFYVQNVLRFAEGDESREDWQCGIELIGDTQPVGDVELILIGCEILKSLGVETDLKLSDPGIVRAVLATAGYSPPEQLAIYDRLLDGNFDILDEIASRIDGVGGTLRPLLSLNGRGGAYIRNLQNALSGSVPGIERPLAELMAVSEILTGLGREHSIEPLLVRNFEYYTGPVFHLYSRDTKIGGGGRYDALIGLVGGGVDVPASGFALDVDALMPLLNTEEDEQPTLVVRPAASESSALAATFTLADALRDAGVAFRIAGVSEPAAGAEAVASGDGYTLRMNGTQSHRYPGADELVRALTSAR